MREVTLVCSACGKSWRRLRMIGARPKRCPECRRPKVAVVWVAPVPTPLLANVPLGPCPCQGCREPLWWSRGRTRIMGVPTWKTAWREEDGTLHRCPEWQSALARARAKWDNGRVGSSDESNRIANGTRVSATTGGAGVVSSIEVVAR